MRRQWQVSECKTASPRGRLAHGAEQPASSSVSRVGIRIRETRGEAIAMALSLYQPDRLRLARVTACVLPYVCCSTYRLYFEGPLT
jgi:hypothetical protein